MEQVVNKGIRQKTAVSFVRGHQSVFPRTPRNTCVYTRHPTFVTATSGLLTRLPAKLSNACSDVRQSAVKNKTASEANRLRIVKNNTPLKKYSNYGLCELIMYTVHLNLYLTSM